MPRISVTGEESSGWYLFIDLLAVQYLSQANPDGLFKNFSDFYQALIGGASRNTALQVHALSDSAMIHSQSLQGLIDFVDDIRSSLFQAGVFFKGGIAEGTASYFHASGLRNFHGVSFAGSGASLAYAGQARLNSTDIILVRQNSNDKTRLAELNHARRSGRIVDSIYFEPGAPREYNEYTALALSKSELGVTFDLDQRVPSTRGSPEGSGAIEQILQNYWYAKHLDARAAGKFVSLLVNVAMHSDYGAAHLDEDGAVWKGITPIFRRMFLNHSSSGAFSDSAFNIVYAVALARVLASRREALGLEADQSPNAVEKIYLDPTVTLVLEAVFRRRGFMNAMKAFPPSVFRRGTGDLVFRLYGFRQQMIASNLAARAPK